MQDLFGGSQSSGSSSSQSGFALLPPELQQAWKQYGSQVSNQFATPQTSAFTPIPQTAGENSALSAINKGFTPDQTQLNSDINMQMNPYDDAVIGTINREANGQGSVLNSALSKAGQFGSNRAALGANDIDLTRLNQIGSFKNNEFNTALDNALKTLPQQRMQDANAQLAGGGFQRNLALQTGQAPINALAAYGKLVGVLPQSGGANSESSQQMTQSKGIIPGIFGG